MPGQGSSDGAAMNSKWKPEELVETFIQCHFDHEEARRK
jgi:hypothetical protein